MALAIFIGVVVVGGLLLSLGNGVGRGGLIASEDVCSAIRANPSKWGLAENWGEWVTTRAARST